MREVYRENYKKYGDHNKALYDKPIDENDLLDEQCLAQDELSAKTDFSLAEIARMDFPPINYLLEPILTDMGGTVIFGGREKIGKSFCILLWMQQLAKKGIKSYYYSAEDNFRRLADRTLKLEITSQEQEMIICRAGKNNPIDRDAFIEELENRFKEDPNLKVAWLDTMLLSLPEKFRKDYSEWSNDIRPWNLLAEKYNRKIVMTHHCNKQGESPKDSLLGSVGIGASFEDRLVIQRDGVSATLYTDGKDIDEKTYQLEKLDYGWKIGDIAQTGITGPSLDYLNTLVTLHYRETGVGLKWSEIKGKLEDEGKSTANLSRDLNKLLENNVFEKFDGVFTPL